MVSETKRVDETGKAGSQPKVGTDSESMLMPLLIILSVCIISSVAIFVKLRGEPNRESATRERSAPALPVKGDSTAKTAPNPGSPLIASSRPADRFPPPSDSAGTANGGGLSVNEADLAYLRGKNLLIPVEGVRAGELHDSFYETRSEGRMHQALDIMASQGTPVLASADGRIKLLTSERGGTMIYVTDSSAPYVYYYAHLQRYADGLCDGKQVSRGEVIGYVGDTGNAGVGNFHLHFGIAKVIAPGKWSGGEPINPYPLLTNR